MDFYQYTTGILSFITFLVIGWQIFTIIDNGRANRKYTRSLVRDLEVKTKTMMASAKADVLMTIAIRCRNNGTLDGFTLALEAVAIAYEENADETTIKQLMSYATGLFKNNQTSVTPAFYERISEHVFFSKIKGEEMECFRHLVKNLEINNIN